MACGTGKTLTSLFINEKLAAERTLVLVPSLSLLKQTMRVWTANSTSSDSTSCPCAPTRRSVAGRRRGGCAHQRSRLSRSPPTRRRSRRSCAGGRAREWCSATYQSSPQIAKAFALGRVPAFDLVIADEAHRCRWDRVLRLRHQSSTPKAIKAQRRLFMTATPRYFTGRVLKAAQEADFEVASMDDERQVRHGVSPAQRSARRSSATCSPTTRSPSSASMTPPTATGRRRAGLVTLDGNKITDARTLAGQIGLAKAMRKYDLHRTISFHSRVKRAREFATAMPDVIAWMPARQRPKGALWSSYASGEMPAGSAMSCSSTWPTRRRRTGSARQRPLPGRRRRRAHPRRRGLHRPSTHPRSTSSRRSVAPSASRRQNRRHHRHPGVHRHRRRPRDRPRRFGVQAGVGRDQGAAGTRR